MNFLNWFGIFLSILYLESNGLVEGAKALRQIQSIVTLHCQSDFKGTTLILDAATVHEGSCYDVSNIFPGCDVGSIDIHPGYCASLYRTNCLDTVTANVSSLTPWLNDIHKSFLGNLGAFIFFQCNIAELSSCKAQLAECVNNGGNSTLSNIELSSQIKFAQHVTSSLQDMLDSCGEEVYSKQNQLDSDLKQSIILIEELQSLQKLCKVELDLLKKPSQNAQIALDNLRMQVSFGDIKLRTCHEEAVATKNEIATLYNNSLGVSYKLERCQNEINQSRQEISGFKKQVYIVEKNIENCHERAANSESNVTECQNKTNALKTQIADAENKAATAEKDSLVSKKLIEQTQSQVDSLQIKLSNVESQFTKCTNEAININQIAARLTTEVKNFKEASFVYRQEAEITKSQVSILEKKIEAANANYNKLRLIACNPQKLKVVACENEAASLNCSTGKIINIVSAIYGRSNRHTCGFQENDTCNVIRSDRIVAERCNGKNSCKVQASNSVFGDPCHGTYKYLYVIYNCIPSYLRAACA